MIISWQHKGLKKFFETGSTSGIQTNHREKLRRRLSLLDNAKQADDLNLPGFKFHKLKGQYKQFYAITVDANWRLIFQFNDGDAKLVDYVDYH